jgi:hypothetical protein
VRTKQSLKASACASHGFNYGFLARELFSFLVAAGAVSLSVYMSMSAEVALLGPMFLHVGVPIRFQISHHIFYSTCGGPNQISNFTTDLLFIYHYKVSRRDKRIKILLIIAARKLFF